MHKVPIDYTSIFVGQLDCKTDEKAVRERFGNYGTIVGVQVLAKQNPLGYRPADCGVTGFAFVKFDGRESATRAVKAEVMFYLISPLYAMHSAISDSICEEPFGFDFVHSDNRMGRYSKEGPFVFNIENCIRKSIRDKVNLFASLVPSSPNLLLHQLVLILNNNLEINHTPHARSLPHLDS
jgi:RNA recognition motif-containing protein